MKLVVENLGAERAGQVIFSQISFELAKGEILILTGANGSGKSTLLRVVTGLLPAFSGTVMIEGMSDEDNIPELMHYLGHLNALKPALSIRENLEFWQIYCGMPLMSIDDALAAVALPDIAHLPAGYLSAGQKRRISIAKLLVSYKPIWIVDEPTAALDKQSEKLFADLVADHLKQGGIAIAATHKPLGLAKTKSLNMNDVSVESKQQYEPLL